MHRPKSVQKTAPCKADVSEAIGLDWHHVAARHGKSVMAKGIDADTKTIDRTITGDSVPELHKALASLIVDPTSLQRTLALYGFKAVPIGVDAANDMTTLVSLTELATAFIKALEDGRRDHTETTALSKLIVPLVQRLEAIVEESRAIEGMAA